MDVDLPKWSRMVISGKDVTKEQAAEIILKTDDLYFKCNDSEWRDRLYECLGIKKLDELQQIKTKLGILPLKFLCNKRIASSYIFGPHGWCSWDGKISHDDDIGRYPNVVSIFEEWELIAKTWKFLDLKCQLYDGEIFKRTAKNPIIEFTIKNGEVSVSVPTTKLVCERYLSNNDGERGCTIDQFKEAINLCLSN